MNILRTATVWGIILLFILGAGCSKAPLPTESDGSGTDIQDNLSKIVIFAVDVDGQVVENADVFWDSELIGKTPLEKEKITPGIHSLRIQKLGYQLFTESVEIAQSNPAFFEAVLTKISLNKGQLLVTVDQDSTTTILSNSQNDVISVFFEQEKSYVLEPGGYFIRAEKVGYRLFYMAIEVKIDSVIVQNVHLEKIENTELPEIVLALPDSGQVNRPVVFSWESNNADRVDIDYIENGGLSGKREVTFQLSGKKYVRAVAYNNQGSVTVLDSIYVADPIVDPLEPPQIDISISPVRVLVGESATLRWQSSNATSVAIDYVPNAGLDGAWQVQFDAPGRYRIEAHAYGPGGSVTDFETLVVEARLTPDPPRIQAFAVVPDSIVQGQTAVLLWEVSGEQVDVFIDQGIGPVGLNGNNNVSPSESSLYTLSARNNGGTVSRTILLKVTEKHESPAEPPTLTLSVTPAEAGIQQNVVIAWQSTHANSVTVDYVPSAGLSGQYQLTFSESGQRIISATAYGDGGTITVTDTVTILETNPPSLNFSVSQPIVEYGDPVTISWASDGYQVVIDQGVGVRGPVGTEELYFENPGEKIFTVIAYGTHQTTTTKTDSVFVNEPEQPELPAVWLAVVDSVEVGQPALVEWHSRNAERVDVDYLQTPGLNGRNEIVFNSEGRRIITATAYNMAGQVTVADTIEVVSTNIYHQVLPIFVSSMAKVAAIHATVPRVIENAGQATIAVAGYYRITASVWYNSGDAQKNESFFLQLKNSANSIVHPIDPNAGVDKVVPDDPGAPHVKDRDAGTFYLTAGDVTISLHHYYTISALYPYFIVGGPINGPESVQVISFKLEYIQP